MWKSGTVLLACLTASFLSGQQPSEIVMGMRIEKAIEEKTLITVVSTGAEFFIDPSGTVTCWQRIPAGRKLLELKLGKSALPFHIRNKDDFSCTVSCPGASLVFHGDSVVILKLDKDFAPSFRGLFKPSYTYEKDGNWFLLDPYGGFGIYPVAKVTTSRPDFNSSSWQITYNLVQGDEVWFGVFPPRPYNWERAFQPIAHESLDDAPYPSNELIQSAGKHCKVFTLHDPIWEDAAEEFKDKYSGPYAGRVRQGWYTAKHIPLDMREFVRVRDEAHKNGMKLVVYVSPYYSHAPDIFAEMRRVLDEYKVDGLYFDGASSDFRKAYAIMRRARQILGEDRVLYYHCTTEPFPTDRIYCPFIDTYADYILRGEAGVWGMELEDYLRWVISGYNISNSVGYWCYYGSNRQQGYNPSSPRGYFDDVPTTEHINAAFRNHAFIWRTEQYWGGGPGRKLDLDRFDREYYGRLESLDRERRASP